MIGATGFENVSQVLKTDRSGPFTGMSENRQGLASYFDSAVPVSTNWYDQTTALSAQQLNAYVTVPGVKDGKPVWVPPNQKPEDKPEDMDWHKKGSGPFKPTQWGYDPKKAAQSKAKHDEKKANQGGKGGNKQHEHKHGEKTLSKRATKRKNLADKLKEHNAESAGIFVRMVGFDTLHQSGQIDQYAIFYIYQKILETKKNLSKQVMDTKEALKKRHPVSKDLLKEVRTKNHELINQQMHSLVAVHDGFAIDLTEWIHMLQQIDTVCKHMQILNVLGTDLPQNTGMEGHYYTSVVGLFLSKVKRQLMEIAYYRAARMREQSDISQNFTRHSLEGTKAQRKLIALKKYHALPDKYEDSAALKLYHEYLLEREIHEWQILNKSQKTPYYLKKQIPRSKEEKHQDYEAAIAKRAQKAKTTEHEPEPAAVTGRGGGDKGRGGRPAGLPTGSALHGYQY
jgi:hypothetical protein